MEEFGQEEEDLMLETETESDLSLMTKDINYEDYGITFPLPPHTDESICRDEFLQRLFVNCPLDERYSKSLTRQSKRSMSYRSRSTIGRGGNMEAFALMRLRAAAPIATSDDESVKSDKRLETRKMMSSQERRVIYKFILLRFQRAAVEYLSVRLKKRLEIIANVWTAETTEIPYNLFRWSESFFLHRTTVNHLYLDVLTMENDITELNCSKFATDVSEIIGILDVIREDVRDDRDYCKSSLKLMEDMNFDVHATWIKELEMNRREKERYERESIVRHRSDSQTHVSLRFAPDDSSAALLPIERRYRLNWLRSAGDQHLMRIEGKEKALKNELDKLKLLIEENGAALESRELVYQLEIEKYRVAIATWEEKLENGMEQLELKGNITRNLLGKAKDDLKFYRERVEMFKQRVAEVLLLEATEEEEERNGLRKGYSVKLASPPKKNKSKKRK
ncbi:uncharacterized protein LOC133841610 [Drosophila sulfurigaster albostrigata]|uniref:uncharacterized protein LOC133841610 n=1 Tax=Drosophila sulfurigaster albostrigata TaxID=89887 RepID=UPI002D2188A1|nr:uncharacterized protein LOC133841610 [Drosophila sulfurigaster albostrigata]